jgi:hypothetical protein
MAMVEIALLPRSVLSSSLGKREVEVERRRGGEEEEWSLVVPHKVTPSLLRQYPLTQK